MYCHEVVDIPRRRRPGSIEVSPVAIDDESPELARADCGSVRGPFWVAGPLAGSFVAWIERSPGAVAGSAPIDAIAFGGAAGARPTGRVDVAADAVVQGACDVDCWAAALVRTADADGAQPAAIALRSYP